MRPAQDKYAIHIDIEPISLRDHLDMKTHDDVGHQQCYHATI